MKDVNETQERIPPHVDIREGVSLKLPSLPLREIGSPTLRPEHHWRGSYDWTAYNAAQLPIMEKYWDRFINLYAQVLPDKYRSAPRRFRGINLGTFNGCFQKAWMRYGFGMYGIEITDVIDELRQYGCEGEQGTFLHMPSIPDNSFDFAVLDRVMCFKRDSYGGKLKPGETFDIRDRLHNSITVPPYFSEIFRILKEDGVFLTVLYTYWYGGLLRELNSHGLMRMWPTDRRRTYLLVTVDRSRQPRPFPDKGLFLERLLAEIKRADSIENVVTELASNPYVHHPIAEQGLLRFQYLPENEIVTIELGESARVIEDAYWPSASDVQAFFARPLSFKVMEKPLQAGYPLIKTKMQKKHLIFLTDGDFIRAELGGPTICKRFLTYGSVCHPGNKICGTNHVLENIGRVSGHEELKRSGCASVALINLARMDSMINLRRRTPRISVEQFSANIRKIAESLQEAGIRVMFCDAIPFCETATEVSEEDRLAYRRRNVLLKQYNKAATDIADELGCKYLKWPSSRINESAHDAFSKNGLRLSGTGTEVILETLLEALKD